MHGGIVGEGSETVPGGDKVAGAEVADNDGLDFLLFPGIVRQGTGFFPDDFKQFLEKLTKI